VPVEEYNQVKLQLSVEQRRAREESARAGEIELLVDRLGRDLNVARVERDSAVERLGVLEKELPVLAPVAAGPVTVSPTELAGTVYFRAGSDKLSDEDAQTVAEIARRLAAVPDAEICVEGHSDPAPLARARDRFASNMEVSATRALAVYHALVGQEGIDAKRVSVAAYGEHRPCPGGPDKLRRVEVRFRRPAAAGRSSQ